MSPHTSMQALHLWGKTAQPSLAHLFLLLYKRSLNLHTKSLTAGSNRADSGAPLWGSRSTYSNQWFFKKGGGGTHTHQCAGTEISHPSSQVPLKPCHTPQVWPLDERVHVGQHIRGTWATAAERQAEICMGVGGADRLALQTRLHTTTGKRRLQTVQSSCLSWNGLMEVLEKAALSSQSSCVREGAFHASPIPPSLPKRGSPWKLGQSPGR